MLNARSAFSTATRATVGSASWPVAAFSARCSEPTIWPLRPEIAHARTPAKPPSADSAAFAAWAGEPMPSAAAMGPEGMNGMDARPVMGGSGLN